MSDVLDSINGKLAAANGADAGAIEVLRFDELLTPNLTTKGLVKGIIDAETLALIYGEAGCGKTFLTLDLALHVAAGQDWFGRRTRTGRVVYVAAEAGRSIRNRVAAWAGERWNGAVIDFAAVVSPVDLCNLKKGDAKRLADAIGTADLIIIDTVSRAMAGGDENSPADMGAFVSVLDRLRAQLGCTLIAIHHVGKDASRGARGHSLLRCAVDTEIAVERRDELVSVATVTKQRDGPGGAEIAFRLRQVSLGTDQDGDPVTSCVVEVADYVPDAKVKGPTGKAKSALDILTQVIGERGELLPMGDIEVSAVSLDEWRKAVERSGSFGDGAKFRVTWKRALDKLREDGHVTFQGEHAWPNQGELFVPF